MMEIMDAHTMDLMNMRSQGKNVEFFLPVVNEWREKLMKVD
jgi:dynein heavy chain